MIKVTLTFENEVEMLAYFAKEVPKETKKEEKEAKEPEVETPKKAKKEISPEKVRKALIDKIRDFIIADKATNVKRVLGVMPQGKKDIVALELEEAQTICLELGIE